MTIQTYGLSQARIDKFKGEIIGMVMTQEVLARQGRQVQMPLNSSKTYVARRWLSYGATAGAVAAGLDPTDRFFTATTAVDRGNLIVQAHQVQEGVTTTPDSITPVDYTAVMQQYSCLYGFTDVTYNLYEDDIPKQMTEQVSQRVALVNEMICYGTLRACTNQFYGGTGTSRSTVNGGLTLGLLRRIANSLLLNHAAPVTKMLDASGKYNTSAVGAGFFVYCDSACEPDARDLPNFVPSEQYASGKALPNEIGKCERFRFITTPEFPPILDGGAAIGATNLQSNLGTSLDVHQFIVCAADGWCQISLRGKQAIDPTFLKPGEKSKSDPHGQRGYAGSIWWKAVLIENNGWLAVGNVGLKNLV